MTVTSCLALPTKRPQLSINDAWTVAHKQTSHSLCAIILPGASQRYLFLSIDMHPGLENVIYARCFLSDKTTSCLLSLKGIALMKYGCVDLTWRKLTKCIVIHCFHLWMNSTVGRNNISYCA